MIDLRREASRLYRSALSGTLPVVDARALAGILRIVGGFIVDGELEARIVALEQHAQQKGNSP
jgi:hypothetical protein